MAKTLKKFVFSYFVFNLDMISLKLMKSHNRSYSFEFKLRLLIKKQSQTGTLVKFRDDKKFKLSNTKIDIK